MYIQNVLSTIYIDCLLKMTKASYISIAIIESVLYTVSVNAPLSSSSSLLLTPVFILLVKGKVQFEVRAEGGEDEGGMGVASIKVNGVEHCPQKPGHNVVVLDPTGEVYEAKNFNTNSGEGPALGKYLDNLPEDHVVLIATQGVTGREQGKWGSCCY